MKIVPSRTREILVPSFFFVKRTSVSQKMFTLPLLERERPPMSNYVFGCLLCHGFIVDSIVGLFLGLLLVVTYLVSYLLFTSIPGYGDTALRECLCEPIFLTIFILFLFGYYMYVGIHLVKKYDPELPRWDVFNRALHRTVHLSVHEYIVILKERRERIERIYG